MTSVDGLGSVIEDGTYDEQDRFAHLGELDSERAGGGGFAYSQSISCSRFARSRLIRPEQSFVGRDSKPRTLAPNLAHVGPGDDLPTPPLPPKRSATAHNYQLDNLPSARRSRPPA
jgi:hypothetical protein